MRLPFLKSKQVVDGWLALSLLPEGVAFAHVRRVPDAKPDVVWCGVAPGAAGAALAGLARERHVEQYRCTTLLPHGAYHLLVVDAPNAPQDELKSAVRWRIKDMLDFHVDDATVDVLDIPPEQGSGRGHSLYAVAAKNEVIKRRQQLFAEAKIPLSVIDIPEMAQRNLAALLEPPGRGLGLLSFDDDGGLLTITHGGELYLARRIEIPLEQLSNADAEQKAHLFERIVLELQRSLDHFDRHFHYVALAKLALAPFPERAALKDYLATNLYVPVDTFELADVLDVSRVAELGDAAAQAALFLTLGAALREEGKEL